MRDRRRWGNQQLEQHENFTARYITATILRVLLLLARNFLAKGGGCKEPLLELLDLLVILDVFVLTICCGA